MSSTPSTNTGPNYGLTPFSDAPTRSELTTTAETGRSNFRTSVIQLDRPGDPSVFDEKTRLEAAEIVTRYPEGQSRSALLPMLHLVQSVQGQITPDGIAFCAETLDLTKAQVAAVVTFYTMYKRTPTGEYLVSVCTNTLCGMLGGDEIFAALKDELGLSRHGGAPGNEGVAGGGETTADGTITLEHAECLAACDYAPVVTVNYEFFDNQTENSARGLVRQLRNGERPVPTRGAPLCTFTQISRQIAGFFDDESAFALESTGTGVPTEVGVKLAIERGDTAPSYAATDDRPSDGGLFAEPQRAPKTKQDEASAGRNVGSGPSQSDAPLETAESDEATTEEPGGPPGETNEES